MRPLFCGARCVAATTLLPFALLATDASAQDPEAREPQQDLETFLDPSSMPGFLGSSRSGITTRFDNVFNPAFSVAIDVLAEAADSPPPDDSRWNQIRARTLELGVASRIDPLGWAYAVAAFVDTGEERAVELEEAVIWFDQLPNDFSLRAGRYLADFGKWNTIHNHDKPYVNEDLVRGEYFGGPLFMTGVELHHWFGVGDVPFRWSVGLASGAEGDSHDAGTGHGHEDAPFVGRRGIDNWAGTARLTAQYDVGDNGYFQWGLSGFYTPGAIEIEEDTLPGGRTIFERDELRKAVVAADFTLRSVNATARTADTVSVEIWHDQSEFHNDADQLRSGGHNGVWGFYEHAFNPTWAAGAVGSWYEHGESEDAVEIFGGGEAGAMRGGFVTWSLSEFNRVRFQAAHHNPGFGEHKFWSFTIQFAAILGAHGHAVDW